MAEEFDVASRLAAGRPAVRNLQQYVWASHQLGYQHPELTLHAAQLSDWYGSEEGMDLGALQVDWLALRETARASQDALALQEQQLAALSTAWQGAGAQASQDFLRRHSEASSSVVRAVRIATEALDELRESLWRTVDTKVDAVVAIERRAQAQRADWLAAAATLRTGVGDWAVATELIDQTVKPFVDNSIRSDWLAAMHTATSSVTDAYRRAAAEIGSEHQPVFELPGDLGPMWSSSPVPNGQEPGSDERLSATAPSAPETAPSAPTTPVAPAATSPSAWGASPAASAPLMSAARSAGGPLAAPEVPVGQSVPLSSMGDLGSGMPNVGSGLSSLGKQLADMLSGLLGSADSSIPRPPELDVPDFDDPPGLNESDLDEGADDVDGATDDVDGATDDSMAEESAENIVASGTEDPEVFDGPADAPTHLPADVSAEVPAESAPGPPAAPPPAEPLPPQGPPNPGPPAAEETPCAIAAGELPQVGDPSE
ncbi:MAG: hypothetical protein K0U69_14690 [Actinomycetia bacterium]|nr:hypothetical protein [Actinomycetes bacterium]